MLVTDLRNLEIPVSGMDCAECTEHVRRAIAGLPGVHAVEVFLTSERAAIRLDPARVSPDAIRAAVREAGYGVPEDPAAARSQQAARAEGTDLARQVGTMLAVLFGVMLFVGVVGEWLGVFERITGRVPWPAWLVLVLAGGYPVFRNVLRAALRRQITSHALMTVGVIAAIAVGQWATALVVVFFMRVGDAVERFTAERARRSLKTLASLAPQTARVVRDGEEIELRVEQVQPGEVVVVRPGERIPVDGEVVDGHATVEQAAITGEPLPVEAGPGSRVYAATIARLGSLRVRAVGIGAASTFGRVIRLVQEAEANRADVQRVADRFSGIYLPVVVGIAALTLLLRRDALAMAAVLVVACSCSFALATPIAVLASVGAAAKRGLLIKGGRSLELLDRADVLLVDKTGTLTLGRPQITDVLVVDGRLQIANRKSQIAGKWQTTDGVLHVTDEAFPVSSDELLRLAASAERYSEHPLAEAVRAAARARGLRLAEPGDFRAEPGVGVRATVDGVSVAVGSRRLVQDLTGAGDARARPLGEAQDLVGVVDELEAQGKTLLFVTVEGRLAGILAAADTRRTEVPAALADVRRLGIRHIELLTGDNEQAVRDLAGELGVPCRANLLPEDKIRIVKEYQTQGHTVVMVGDGVNDAPALAQADVGVAMAATGSDVAIEASHAALLRDDWTLVPELFRIARRTMRVVRMNLAFTALYNIAGLSLAALGILPPILAAAAQSLPDLGILSNSARLLRQR